MLVLYETALGYCLFKMSDSLSSMDQTQIRKEFESAEKANKLYVKEFYRLLNPSLRR